MWKAAKMKQILEVLKLFQCRSIAPELAGRTCATQEAFLLAADELEIAIREDSPLIPVACVPPSCIELVHVAIHFDPHDEQSWEDLGTAALGIQEAGEA
jgi:hypothetical protein